MLGSRMRNRATYQLGLALPTAPRNLRDRAPAGSPFSVRQLIWPKTDVVGRWVRIELNGVDAISSLPHRLGNPMSTVHHRTAGGEDYRECQIRLLDQSQVGDHRAPRRPFLPAYPFLVQLSNVAE